MQFIQSGTFCLCLAGGILFFAHSIVGQGTRELIDIDLILKPSQPQPPGTVPASPNPIASQTSRVLLPTPSNPAADSPPLSSASPSDGRTPLTNIPTTSGGTSGGFLRDTMFSLPSGVPVVPSQSSDPDLMPRNPVKPISDAAVSILEEYTEDEQEEREILFQRQRAEQIADPEQQQIELDRIAMAETNYRNRLARRKIDEAGAKLFYVPRMKEQLLKEGWCQLFDGYTDYGWKIQTEGHYAGGKFTFGQNEISSDPYHPGLIYTQIPFGNVSVRINYWAEKESEAYLLMNTHPAPADLSSSCYAFVLNSRHSDRPRGVPLGRHGLSLLTLREMRDLRDDPNNKEEGTWHSITVNMEENEYQVWLDKRLPETYFDHDPIPSGHIALLVTKGKVRFQSILWQPNRSVSVFNTENTAVRTWRLSDGAKFSETSELGFNLQGGSVESKEIFRNYVLQMEYMQGMNSGQASLFIRSLPGMEKTGYEISLQNFPRQQDREAASGVDAGSFRQFEDARYIRVQDRRWTYLTVAAVDKQFQTWINGVPVCAIEDKRNVPTTTGPFLEPGTIRLSAPEENTAFQFRRLTVSALSP